VGAIGYNYGVSPSSFQQLTGEYFVNTTTEIGFAVGSSPNAFITVGSYVKLSGYTATVGPDVNGVIVLITAAPTIGMVNSNYVGTPTVPLPTTGNGSAGTMTRFSIPLPDLRLASPIGFQAGTIAYGTSGGSATTTLTITNLPPHSHTLWQGGASASQGSINVARLGDPNVDSNLATGGNIYRATDTPTSGSRVQQVGQDGTGQTAFSTRNPYVAMNYIIKAET
jgi:microcystin-dependent protein